MTSSRANSEGLAAIKEKNTKALVNNVFISTFGFVCSTQSRVINSFSAGLHSTAEGLMSAPMPAALSLMDDDAVDGLVAAGAGIIHRDRMVRLERMVINRRTVVINKRNVSAVAEAPMLVPSAETDVVRAKPAPGAVEMVSHRRHRQSCGNHR